MQKSKFNIYRWQDRYITHFSQKLGISKSEFVRGVLSYMFGATSAVALGKREKFPHDRKDLLKAYWACLDKQDRMIIKKLFYNMASDAQILAEERIEAD